MSSILNPDFKYVPAASTDIRKLFARVRRELKEKAEAEKRCPKPKVELITRRKA